MRVPFRPDRSNQARTHVRSVRLRALTFAAAAALLWNGLALGAGGTNGGSAWNMEVVGHSDLAGRGFNADVWEHEGFAYVGSWGFPDWAAEKHDRFCPSTPGNGIAVVDATDPANPEFVARLIPPPGTSSEDVVVFTAQYGPLAGRDIAGVGIQTCGANGYDLSIERGLQLFDVTAPAHPAEIGFWDSECCARGVHELEVQHRADLGRTFAYLSVPGSRDPDASHASGYKDEDGDGDFRLIDITDPTAPFQASSWGIQEAGGPFSPGLGCEPDENYGHSAEPSADGRTAFFAQWDGGFFRLDLTDPSNPVYLSRTVYPANADGQAHSSQWDESRELLFGNDEDFCKTATSSTEKGYGYMRIYDYSDPAHPVQIGAYKTPNASGTTDPAGGDFSIHNNWLSGTDVYSSWYSDGVRVIDTSDPTRPVEIAYFVPPAGQNPVKPSMRSVLSNKTQVWGVVVDEETGLIYASDMNTGLWILRRTD
jgi:hypothetical protein